MEDDKKNESIGKVAFTFMYLWYTIKYTALFSLIALAVLYFLKKPLWLAPIIGFGVFVVYRLIRRLFFVLVIKFGRWGSGK